MMENIPAADVHTSVTDYEEQLWLIQQQQPERCLQQLLAWRLDQQVNLSQLSAAIQTLINATPELNSRLLFSEEGDLYKFNALDWQACFTLLHAPSNASAIEHLLMRQAMPWDAQNQPPFQALLILSEGSAILGLLVHRILACHYDARELFRALQNAYNGSPLALSKTMAAPQPLATAQSVSALPWLHRHTQHNWLIRNTQAAPKQLPDTLALRWQSQIDPATLPAPLTIAVNFAQFVARQGNLETLGLGLRYNSSFTRQRLEPGLSTEALLQAINQPQTATDPRLDDPQLAWVQVEILAHADTSPSPLPWEELLLPSAEQRPDLELLIAPQTGHINLTLSTGQGLSPYAGEYLLHSFLTYLSDPTRSVALAPISAPTHSLSHSPAVQDTAQIVGIILEQFRRALDEPDMQADDDFFDFGGHSLLATRIIGTLLSQYGVELQFNDFFSAPSANKLAACAQLAQPAASSRQEQIAQDEQPQVRLRSPLALAQASLWRAYEAFDLGKIFNLPFAVRFLDRVDETLFEQAFTDLLIRHPSLRTLFNQEQQQAYQELVPVTQLNQYKWFWNSSESIGLSVKDEAQHQFDLRHELPLRVRFFTDPQTQQQSLSLLVQHMAIDEWSLNVMLDELAHAYLARAVDKAPTWSRPAGSFHDFARLQQRSGLNQQHLDYWTAHLRDASRGLTLPLATGQTSVPAAQASVTADWLELQPEQATIDKLYSVAREHQSSLFSLVYTAIALVLHKLGQLDDLVIGTSASGRSDADYHQSVGYFTTMVAHRVQFNPQHSVAQLIKHVTQTINNSMPYADVPMEHIQQALGMSPADGLLFDVYVQIHADNALNGELRNADGEAIRYRQIDPQKNESMFGLQFEIMENFLDGQRRLRLVITHRTDRYPAALAQRISDMLAQLLILLSEPATAQTRLLQLQL